MDGGLPLELEERGLAVRRTFWNRQRKAQSLSDQFSGASVPPGTEGKLRKAAPLLTLPFSLTEENQSEHSTTK